MYVAIGTFSKKMNHENVKFYESSRVSELPKSAIEKDHPTVLGWPYEGPVALGVRHYITIDWREAASTKPDTTE